MKNCKLVDVTIQKVRSSGHPYSLKLHWESTTRPGTMFATYEWAPLERVSDLIAQVTA